MLQLFTVVCYKLTRPNLAHFPCNISLLDTDSVFVSLPGRNRSDAFKIGKEISEEITAKSPAEVILKFEKVYESCILVTKKRYVGWSYETESQILPHLDAKG